MSVTTHPANPRILITSYSGELGGMEIRMADEARLLRANGYQPSIAIRHFRGVDQWAQQLRQQGIPVSHYDPPPFIEHWSWRRFNKLRANLFSRALLKRSNPALVHVFFCWTIYGGSALWLAHKCGIPSVISVHNAFPLARLPQWTLDHLREAFQSLRGVYGVSQSALDHFLANYRPLLRPDIKTAVIPNSVDTERFVPNPAARQQIRRQFDIDDTTPLLGAVGRMSEQKRPLELIRILAGLMAQRPDVRFLFVGDGPLLGEAQALVQQLGLQRQILFAGFRDNPWDYFAALDLHVLNSWTEGFGLATAEAMACGVPAVGTDVPGTRDILQGCPGGMLIDATDDAAKQRQLRELLQDPARLQQMASQARPYVETHFARTLVEGQLMAFYREVLA